MAFVDEVTIHAEAGKGGDGVVRWLRTRGNARGGPSGGDGGKGGNVIAIGVQDAAVLAQYHFEKNFRAQNGEAGSSSQKQGADGDDCVLSVPVGTVARVLPSGEGHEIIHENQRVVLLRGGIGGKGNTHFKSSTNQNPFQSTKGKEGESGDISFILKLIADVGFVGLPNAGKSSLLNALTRAKSKIGEYPFTTLEPNLGNFYGHILADIPGLIKGASQGKGLGAKFLKHIERTGFILHFISADQDDPIAAYKEIRGELESFGRELDTKREYIVLSKTDLISQKECETKIQLLIRETGREVHSVSIRDEKALKNFSDWLARLLA